MTTRKHYEDLAESIYQQIQTTIEDGGEIMQELELEDELKIKEGVTIRTKVSVWVESLFDRDEDGGYRDTTITELYVWSLQMDVDGLMFDLEEETFTEVMIERINAGG